VYLYNPGSLRPCLLCHLVVGFLSLGEQGIENLTRWSAALSYGGLAFITWATIAIGDPFTRQYARRTTPKEWWTSELFLSSTMSMALGWAVAFLGATVRSITGALTGLKRDIDSKYAVVVI
jgi:hypothetical protein